MITGFGSVCLDGLEITLQSARIDIDGAPASAQALRAGQFVAIRATGETALSAETVSIRRQVVGPVESVSDEMIEVAGQSVVTRAVEQPELAHVRPGTWIAVSGLPRPDGRIAATRIDRIAEAGDVLVRGPAVADGGHLRVGRLPIPSGMITAGAFVMARGTAGPDGLTVTSVEPDLLADDPGRYFGPGITRVVLQAFITPGPGMLSLVGGPTVSAAPGVAPLPGVPQVAVIQPALGGLPQAVGIGLPGAGGIPGLPGSAGAAHPGVPIPLGPSPLPGPALPSPVLHVPLGPAFRGPHPR